MINIIPFLNNITNILTAVLYISYSIIKRIDASQFIIVALAAAWVINISLLIYSILKILNDQEVIEKSRKTWIYFRTIVNFVFLLLTIYLF
jgi:hypothetical protein